MKATSEASNFKAVPLPAPATVGARCCAMIDIGTVPNVYQGVEDGVVHKIWITWELPSLKAVFNEEFGEKPFVISEEMTLSTGSKANLPKMVAQWRGKPLTEEEKKSFDPTVMVGKVCLISFVHKTRKKFANEQITTITNENTDMKMGGIVKKPTEMSVAPAILDPFIWDWEEIEEKGWTEEIQTKWDLKFAGIPFFIKKKMFTSEEFQRLAPASARGENSQTQPEQQTTTQVATTTQETQPIDDGKVSEDENW